MPRDCSDCIFITGLPQTVDKQQISDFFCKAGTILVTKGRKFSNLLIYFDKFIKTNALGVQRIFLFMGKDKVPTGEATVTYENPESSMRAIEQFNGNDFNGQGNISVSIATPDQKQPFAQKLVSSDS